MSLEARLRKFEERMLKLKGVKLPASGLVTNRHNKYGREAIAVINNNVGKILVDIDQEYIIDEALDDIVTGVARSFDVASSHKGSKLNIATIRSMLDKLPIISQMSIMDNYGYGRQQASKYLQACKLVVMFYKRHNLKQSMLMLARFSD